MSTNDLKRFIFGVPDKSVDTFNQKISGNPTLDNTMYNMTGGMKRGMGVRYGIAPIPGHNNTETPAVNQNNGIQRSEVTSGALGLTHRERVYGIVPITMAPYDGAYPKGNKQYYAYIVGLDYGADVSLDVCLGSTVNSGVYKHSSTLIAGLQASSYRQETPLVRLHKTELINLPLDVTPTAASVQAILKGVTAKWFTSYAKISVPGKRVPYQWMLARALNEPTSTSAPNLNLWQASTTLELEPIILGGSPSEIITREFDDNNQRKIYIYCLEQCVPLDMQFIKEITQDNTFAANAYDTSVANYSGLTSAIREGVNTSYSSVNSALINDPGSFTNTRHEAILITACEGPIAVVYQDWLKSASGMLPRWIDLSKVGCTPRFGLSYYDNVGTNQTPSSAFQPSPGVSFKEAAVGSGFLDAGFTYDIGFSYYNKLLDYETNVSYATTILVTGTPGQKRALFAGAVTGGNVNQFEDMMGASNYAMPWEFSNTKPYTGSPSPRGMHVNDYEIRFYYRLAGIGEWLPAGFFDASKFWFFYKWTTGFGDSGPLICQSPQGSLPGGQPNGFNDYSPLPKQRYICALIFQQRAVWFSEKSLHFSYQNNIYAYPSRNTVTLETGRCRGGIVHAIKNTEQSQSRMIVYADSVYEARFTGDKYVQNIQVSVSVDGPVMGQFPIDGSDFVVDYLCDETAFSYRSSVIAEGVAYWWGPKGIMRYDGVVKPVKISLPLESDVESESIFNYVDMGRDQEVHCIYNDRSHEIIWFYPPKVTDATYPTYGLALNIENRNFYHYKFKCQVDSSQNLEIENDETPDGIDGERIILHCRETAASTIQRSYFFDELAVAGDQGPAQQLSVISFTSPTTGTRRLVLAAGSAGITASGIVANDYISFQNVKGYAPSLTLAPDMIAKIIAVNNASNYIDIELPPGGLFDATATLTGQTAFPIYHRGLNIAGLNGIPYLYQTNYWLADGLYQAWYWQYLYFLFKYPGIPQPRDPFRPREGILSRINLTFESTSGDSHTDILSLINNTKDHCQIHHPLYNQERSANGQALRFALSGIYIGDHWTFEYLEAHCLSETGFTLKEFEG